MSEKGSQLGRDVEERATDAEYPPPYGPQHGYPVQQSYVYPSHGFMYPTQTVVQSQPPYQGYVIQPPPPTYGTDYTKQMAQVVTIVPQQLPHDYMMWAILVTLFCFFPTGVIAIMRVCEARSAAAYGDIENAERHNKMAKRMINISIIVGVLCTGLLIALVVLYLNLVGRMTAQNYHY